MEWPATIRERLNMEALKVVGELEGDQKNDDVKMLGRGKKDKVGQNFGRKDGIKSNQ